MRFYIYFDADLRRYYPLRQKQEEDYQTRLVDVVDVDFPEGHIMTKDEYGSNIIILPTGERIPLHSIEVEENSMSLYWENYKTGKVIRFQCKD